MTSNPEFQRVLGNARQGFVHDKTDQKYNYARGEGAEARRPQQSVRRADRDHDKHNLETFE